MPGEPLTREEMRILRALADGTTLERKRVPGAAATYWLGSAPIKPGPVAALAMAKLIDARAQGSMERITWTITAAGRRALGEGR